MEGQGSTPKKWKVVIGLMDEQGNVKFNQPIDAEPENKTISFAIGEREDGVTNARPHVIEWKVDELFKAVKSDGSSARLNGKQAGFQVKATIRFSDYEVQLEHKNRACKPKAVSKGQIDL